MNLQSREISINKTKSFFSFWRDYNKYIANHLHSQINQSHGIGVRFHKVYRNDISSGRPIWVKVMRIREKEIHQ